MEKLLNHYDKEYLKIAMLKHEETFREQVYELHRLYRIQKMLMKDISKSTRKNNPHYATAYTRAGPAHRREFIYPEPGDRCGVLESEDDQGDLELTLGPRSYYRNKIKEGEAAFPSDSGPSFSSSSRSTVTREVFLSQQKWGPEMAVTNNQDRLNTSPPWLFQALSLNMT